MENKFTNIKVRCLQFAEYQKISKETFCKMIGQTYGNFKGKNKNTPLNSSTIENILSLFPGINLTWLITGEGEMLKSDADERPSAEPTIIYKSDPRDTEMIELQRFKIKELERQLSAAGVKSGFAQSAGRLSRDLPPKKR